MAQQYKVELVTEGGCGTLLLGSSSLPVAQMEAVMNRFAAQGWRVHFMLVEQRRFMLFWKRETAVITFVRDV